MSEWKPIETAPKDGTRIMLWPIGNCRNGLRMETGHWCLNGHWKCGERSPRATHWMPLPEPPDGR